jgi:hypothetical protein
MVSRHQPLAGAFTKAAETSGGCCPDIAALLLLKYGRLRVGHHYHVVVVDVVVSSRGSIELVSFSRSSISILPSSSSSSSIITRDHYQLYNNFLLAISTLPLPVDPSFMQAI